MAALEEECQLSEPVENYLLVLLVWLRDGSSLAMGAMAA